MRFMLALCFALTAPFFLACSAGPDTTVRPGPPIPGLNLSGKWYSAEFGDMRLVQNGNDVTGTYEHPRGPDHNGRVKGRVEGDLLRIEWVQPGNPIAAVQPLRGRAWFRLKQGGNFMEGQWGYDDSESDGGPWKAEKSQFQ
ncbi:MAG: hypothetical protein KC620_01165 [Myxococcales bacterium]|nr:hypothetical protein [Myxococcales bacterium]